LGPSGGRDVSAPNRMPPETAGPINKVPCPHCGGMNDFRDLEVERTLERGEMATCDLCNRVMLVVAVKQITVVKVRPAPGMGEPVQAVQPARTIGASGIKRLLGGR
jgi:hypothetical protein